MPFEGMVDHRAQRGHTGGASAEGQGGGAAQATSVPTPSPTGHGRPLRPAR